MHTTLPSFKSTPILTVFLLTSLATSLLHGAEPDELGFAPGPAFDEVWESVHQQFCDPNFNGVDWQQMRDRYRPQAIAAKSHDEFAGVINSMLAHLETSHTYYFATTDPRHYQLLGVFEAVAPDNEPDLFTYEGIGIGTTKRGEKHFISAAFDGLPAAEAGLRFGDEIVAIDSKPFHPTRSFLGKAGKTVKVSVRRDGPDSPTRNITVPVTKLNGRTMFETALQASAEVIKQGDKQIGYVHVWCYAGRKYHDMLQNLILWGDLAQCDSLVLDLRDGWGGASLDYINVFRKPFLTMSTSTRNGEPKISTGTWGKPVILLTNGGTTSGKELFTFAFRKLNLGEVVGTRTAGAVVAGRCTRMGNGDVLYLAVVDILVDGVRLEGKGVQPTVNVPRPLEYAAGEDAQLEKAVEILGGNRPQGKNQQDAR